jgi:LysM repeat protein
MPVAAQNQTYVVQRGDSLSKIAARFGVTLQSLISTNNLINPNLIYAGQVLVIPATGGPVVPPPVRTYTVRPGDQLRFIAASFGTTWQAIAAANNLVNPNVIYTGQVLIIPATGGPVVPPPVVGNRYVVQRGDTMFKIARMFGRDVYNIARANGILNLNQIFTGQVLVIP